MHHASDRRGSAYQCQGVCLLAQPTTAAIAIASGSDVTGSGLDVVASGRMAAHYYRVVVVVVLLLVVVGRILLLMPVIWHPGPGVQCV